MCGIVGVIGKKQWGLYPNHRKAFEDMLYMDALRGEDSTGIFSINKYGNVEWCKEAIPSYYHFKDSPDVNSLLNNAVTRGTAIIGHNRKATMGGTKDDAAHPFVADNIIMVHNGTLRNHNDFGFNHAVDSEIFANVIQKHGFFEALQNINGAFAIAVYDINTKILRLARNGERPLGIVETENAFFFASELFMGWGAAWRHDFKIEKFHDLPMNTVMTFDLSQDVITPTLQEFDPYNTQRGNALKPAEPEKKLPIVAKKQTHLPWPNEAANKEGAGKIITFPKPAKNKDYKKGDFVCFVPEKVISHDSTTHKLEGQHWSTKAKVFCWLPKDTSREEALAWTESTLICATVTSTMDNRQTDMFTIHADEPLNSVAIVSMNGEELNEEQIDKMSDTCIQCKQKFDVNDLYSSYIKVRKNGHIQCTCPTCVDKNLAKNPKWGGLNEKSQSSSVQAGQ